MHHVIVGAGPAGITAAETIRKHQADARITVIGGEPGPPYSRMAIPYFLAGDIVESGTHLRPAPGHYVDLGVEYVNSSAAGLDASAKTVALTNGDDVAYDRLLIATGAAPVRPKIEGALLPGVHTCWTLKDARHIERLAAAGAPVVLVGAGFIGSIILEALKKKGVKLTVVEMGARMVPRMLDETAGTMLQRWCEERGLRVITGTTVTSIARKRGGRGSATAGEPPREVGVFERWFGGGAGSYVRAARTEASDDLRVALSNGETLDAKLVVIATGVRSNIDFLAGSGLVTGNGLRVNDHLATIEPDIFAAGDVAEARDLSTGGFDVLAIQPVAVEHGYVAGLNMAGLAATHQGSLNMNILDTIGLISSSFGLWMGVDGGQRASLVDKEGWRYMRLEFDGDRLVGGQAVGMTDHIGCMRGLIQSGKPLGRWKDKLLKSPERLAEAYVATTHGL